MIETIGLAAAIEAADTAVKAANVKLLGYELSKGNGMVTIKIEGDVGAVNAAVKAACVAAEKVNKVWSKTIIPRPHSEINKLIVTKETIGNTDAGDEDLKEQKLNSMKYEEKYTNDVPDIASIEKKKQEIIKEEKHKEELPKVEEVTIIEATSILEEIPITEGTGQSEVVKIEEAIESKKQDTCKKEKTNKKAKKTCNLCGDPECGRKKGEARSLCIHYEEIKK
jgi:microcompartment protein CcmL/EutN